MTTATALPDPIRQPEFYADIPLKRGLAFVVDFLLIAVLCVVILPFTAFTGLFFFPFLMLVTGFIYRIVTLANGSATLGMRLMGMEFRTATGARFDLSMALLHTLGFYLSISFFLAQLASIVMMLTSPTAQGLTDRALGTFALNRRAGQ